jgi:hypothetical protein
MIMTKPNSKSVFALPDSMILPNLRIFPLNISSTTSFFHMIVKPPPAYIQTSYRRPFHGCIGSSNAVFL